MFYCCYKRILNTTSKAGESRQDNFIIFLHSNEGLNGVNRQPSNGQTISRQTSKTEYFYRQPSSLRAKISRQIPQISLNDRDRLTKLGHQLVEQAINTSSGNGDDASLSNKPQVSMVYKLINHAGCW